MNCLRRLFQFQSDVFLFFILLFIIATAHAELNEKPFVIMTFNIENGGTQIDFNQVVKAIKQSKADVVGIQEAWGNIKRLAKALNWHYDPYQHVISRFPLYKTAPQQRFVLIEIKPKQFVAVANVHLPDEPYGPDLIKQGFDARTVRKNELKIRLPEIKPVIDQLAALAKKGVPVFLTGDFNSPSHLDWSHATLQKQRNHRYVMNWPVTQYAANKGFIDSYRQIFPNAYQYPSITWPAKRAAVKSSIDNYNPSYKDLPDRIDFIFSSGPVQVINSQLIGEKNGENVGLSLTPWPSDHRAIVSRFKVKASHFPIQHMKLFLVKGEYQNKKPQILVSKKSLKSGESFKIIWKNAPGYYYDYISISPKDRNRTMNETVRLYTQGEINGIIQYANKNVQGNWINWYKAHASWPLAPGAYDVKLMLDDGYNSLATTQIMIK
ncbi:Endonuclease/Exonuclease/phosphatase family protein [Legionella gratiana]|uniref:Endonuclease/Exonuclease/phosphatase family protein n=1 Tax=Legionella gratiana TaxID=45066 RepID=A0A378JEU1_9GAMM|nr:endonuclease/exonuclease/phosphatase family protein [Legionella gratiana]KTD10965.1 Endonuclease/Exonuclease/phosphatase family protein [Legionella gratiana]STX45939.1 Uncharacterized protein conserved in bacteria [Legionella gratiana]